MRNNYALISHDNNIWQEQYYKLFLINVIYQKVFFDHLFAKLTHVNYFVGTSKGIKCPKVAYNTLNPEFSIIVSWKHTFTYGFSSLCNRQYFKRLLNRNLVCSVLRINGKLVSFLEVLSTTFTILFATFPLELLADSSKSVFQLWCRHLQLCGLGCWLFLRHMIS